MIILAIESSCDEFSIAIGKNNKIIANIISSQINEHSQFGGVVPELASRLHLENFHWVLEKALLKAKVSINEITHIAYTNEPGLIGSLIIGRLVAQTLANFLKIPLIPLNHIHGHIYGASIEQTFKFPLLSLVASGGHTQIILSKKHLDFNIIGSTQDDAIGECYDKVSRVLGLGYPGGPILDKLAQKGDSKAYKLPISKQDNTYDFSYSGLKTASINLIRNLGQKNQKVDINNFCASFQFTAIETLISKFERAIKNYSPKCLVLAGGVSANSELRKKMLLLGEKYKIKVCLPKMEYCTDNAAMIAALAYETIRKENI